MSYVEWRDNVIMSKNKPKSTTRDQVKNTLMVLVSKADSIGKLPEGVKDRLNAGILKKGKTRKVILSGINDFGSYYEVPDGLIFENLKYVLKPYKFYFLDS